MSNLLPKHKWGESGFEAQISILQYFTYNLAKSVPIVIEHTVIRFP